MIQRVNAGANSAENENPSLATVISAHPNLAIVINVSNVITAENARRNEIAANVSILGNVNIRKRRSLANTRNARSAKFVPILLVRTQITRTSMWDNI
jgi:hypothetical protein